MHSYESFMENTELSKMLTWQKTLSGRLWRNRRDCPIGVKQSSVTCPLVPSGISSPFWKPSFQLCQRACESPSTLSTMLHGSHSMIRSCSKTSMYGCDQSIFQQPEICYLLCCGDLVIRFWLLSLVFEVPGSGMSCSEIQRNTLQ